MDSLGLQGYINMNAIAQRVEVKLGRQMWEVQWRKTIYRRQASACA